MVEKIATFKGADPEHHLKETDFKLSCNGVPVSDEMTIANHLSWGDKEIDLCISLVLRGGGGLVIKHTSKDKGIMELKKRAKLSAPLKEDIDEAVTMPPQFVQYVEHYTSKIQQVKVRFGQDIPVLKYALKAVSTQDLEACGIILDTRIRGGRGDDSYAKFKRVMCIIYPLLTSMEESTKRIANDLKDFHRFFVERFIETYARHADGITRLDTATLLNEVIAELESRRTGEIPQSVQQTCIIC